AEIQHVRARETATLARLMQTQAALRRHQAELEQQKHRHQQTQHQIQLELQRLVIRAPAAGTLQSLTIRNPGQVVETGEAIAQLAPQTAALVIQAQVGQADASRIQPGQSVHVRLDSCPYTDYGLLQGYIHAISPDTERLEPGPDPASTFYRVEIVPAWQPSDSRSERPSLQSGKRTCFLQMGMLGRADIVTQRETVLIAMLRRLRLLTDL
ncbi:MAG TPA: HlyD family efflux transporter periplasmic adaptor subunit, partial [Candidatus Obscuribacterales bacterium]